MAALLRLQARRQQRGLDAGRLPPFFIDRGQPRLRAAGDSDPPAALAGLRYAYEGAGAGGAGAAADQGLGAARRRQGERGARGGGTTTTIPTRQPAR